MQRLEGDGLLNRELEGLPTTREVAGASTAARG